MNNVSSKKGWMTGMTQRNIGPPLIPLNKEKHDGKSDKDSVKLELHINSTPSTSDLYEFKISLFDNGKPEDFCCLFVTSTWPSRRQGIWRWTRSISTFVLYQIKGWGKGTNIAHVDPPPIPLIKETYNGKSDGYYVKIKLSRNPTSSTLYHYEFRMSLFNDCEPK